MTSLKRLWELLNAHIGWLFLAGLAVVTLWNWHRWRQDRALALRFRQSKPQPLRLNATPKVSILVAAWNEAHIIREHIESFLRLSYPDKELILCAGGGDGTYQIARRRAGERVVVLEQRPGEGKQRALRRCLDKVSGEIILLTDADCLLDDQAFLQTLAPLAQEEERIATGSRRPLDQQLGNPFVVYQWYYHAYCAARHPQYVEGLEGRNMAIRREVLEQAGGFSADVPIGTDRYLAHQLLAHRYHIRYVPRSEMRTQHSATFGEYWRQQSRWHRNVILHGTRFGAWTLVRGCIQRGLIGLFMLGTPLVAFWQSAVLASAWALLLVQGFLSRVRYVRWGEILNDGNRAQVPRNTALLVYMLVDFVAWMRACVDLLRPGKRWTW